MTLEELKKLYGEKGATTRREEQTEAGTQYYDEPIQLGDGWTAWENQPQMIGYEGQGMDAQPIYGEVKDKLGGFQRSEGDKNYIYDTTGKLIRVEKQATDWDYLGPIIMGAMTMGGGSAALGSYLFPSLGATAAAGAGGALAGGFNAAMTDQDILKGALKGGVGSAGALKLSDVLGADVLGSTFKDATLGDVTKTINFAQNPTLAGAANLASPYVKTNFDIGDTGFTTNDILKGVNTAQALGSGDKSKIFKAITGLAGGAGSGATGSTVGVDKSTIGNFDDNEVTRLEGLGYSKDQIKDYFKRLENITDVFDNPDEGFPVDLISQSLPPAGLDKSISNVVNSSDTVNNVKTTADSNQDIFDYINSLGGDSIKDSGLSNQDIMDMIGGGTDDAVVITGDRPTGLGDFMVPNITGNVAKSTNVADKGEMVITGNRNGTSLDDFTSLNTPAGDVSNNYTLDDTGELVITGNKNGTSLNDFISLNTPAGDITNNYTDDLNELVITGNKNGLSLNDFITLNTPAGDITNNYADDTVFVTGDLEKPYVPSIRTKDIVSDITDIDLSDIPLIPAGDINDILQTVTVPGGTTTTPTKITTTPPKTTTTTKTTEDLMASLGLGSGKVSPSQDPYANIKLMEELFGGDIAYKLRALGAPKNIASADMDALMKLLRG